MTDPISDMLTRIRNAVRARHPRVEIPHSNMKLAIASVEKGKFKSIRVTLRYDDEGTPILSGIQMVSRPGRRIYAGSGEIPPVMGGLGVSIVSTPKGVLSGRDARKAGVG